MKLATLCYIQTDTHTLMMHRNKKKNDMHKGKWNGLGGKLHNGESPEECVIREVKEESGLIIENPRLKGFITFPAFDDIDDWYVFVFTTHKFMGKLMESHEGELQWIKNENLHTLNLWEGDYIFIPWLGRDKIFSARFNYDKGKLVSHQVSFY